MIPLILKLKKKSHKDVARAQDIIINVIYKVFENAVLHGGTGIWRCYGGNRFSDDINVYIPKNNKKINIFFEELEKIGFVLEKKKITKNSIFSKLNFNGVLVRFEALFKNYNGVLKDYETVDNNFITIYSLTAEQFVNEKARTYLKRFKIRDLYDVFFMIKYVKNKNAVINVLAKLVKDFKQPVDEKDLRVLIFEGIVPETDKMLTYIKNYI